MTAELSPDRGTLTVSVSIAIRSRGGRKQVVSPAGAPDWAPREPQVDSTLVKALARAFRWRRLLEDGSYSTMAELAAADKISASYLSRVLRLTLLAPEIVEAMLDGRQGPDMSMLTLFRRFPVEWDGQREAIPGRSGIRSLTGGPRQPIPSGHEACMGLQEARSTEAQGCSAPSTLTRSGPSSSLPSRRASSSSWSTKLKDLETTIHVGADVTPMSEDLNEAVEVAVTKGEQLLSAVPD